MLDIHLHEAFLTGLLVRYALDTGQSILEMKALIVTKSYSNYTMYTFPYSY